MRMVMLVLGSVAEAVVDVAVDSFFSFLTNPILCCSHSTLGLGVAIRPDVCTVFILMAFCPEAGLAPFEERTGRVVPCLCTRILGLGLVIPMIHMDVSTNGSS